MAPGRAELLEAIGREGSISGAGRAMGISYRHAWLLVDVINRCWSEKVIETNTGGGRGGGAQLTDFGRHLLQTYRDLEQQLADVLEQSDLMHLTDRLLDVPVSPVADSTKSNALRAQSRSRKVVAAAAD